MLHGMLGPELAYEVLAAVPEMLDVPLEQLQGTVAWLREELLLEPVPALMASRGPQVEDEGLGEEGGQALVPGELLLVPDWQLVGSYEVLKGELGQWLGWRERRVRAFLRRCPDLVLLGHEQMREGWRGVEDVAEGRWRWREDLQGARGKSNRVRLVSAVLRCGSGQLQKLQYLVEHPRQLGGIGLNRVLRMGHVDFVESCNGYLAWRQRVEQRR
jgi:hypothetical protein